MHIGRSSLLVVALLLSLARPAQAQYRWLNLPLTPKLPVAERSGYAPVNGVRIWYAEFGLGKPVILVHGGLANSDYFGLQVRALAHIIVWSFSIAAVTAGVRADGSRSATTSCRPM